MPGPYEPNPRRECGCYAARTLHALTCVRYYVSGLNRTALAEQAGPFLTEAKARKWAREANLRHVVVDRVVREA